MSCAMMLSMSGCGETLLCGGSFARARAAKRKLGVRERLERKLLSGRARALVAEDLQTADADVYRESMQNRWAEV